MAFIVFFVEFSHVVLQMRYNNDLLNQFGNLLQRCTSTAINPSGSIPLHLDENAERNMELEAAIDGLSGETLMPSNSVSSVLTNPSKERFDSAVSRRDFGGALEEAGQVIADLNKFFTDSKPWTLAKKPDAATELRTILFYTYEGLRIVATLLQPVMPSKAADVLNRLSVDAAERTFFHARMGKRTSTDNGRRLQLATGDNVIFTKLIT